MMTLTGGKGLLGETTFSISKRQNAVDGAHYAHDEIACKKQAGAKYPSSPKPSKRPQSEV